MNFQEPQIIVFVFVFRFFSGKKFSEVSNLDKTSDTYYINEAFTFESLSSSELSSLSIEFELINFLTKETVGKLNIEYSTEMFDNQLLNLDILPVMSHLEDASSYRYKSDTNNAASPMRQHMGQMNQDNSRVMSIESLNSNGANQRRKLPTLPPAKQLPQIPQGK